MAKQLARLSDEWIIRWGFFYNTDHEGDFLICGPRGGVLVLEIKDGQLRKLGSTGCWDGAMQDHPINQLLAEWNAVVCDLSKSARGRRIPFVAKVLCLPDITIGADAESFQDFAHELLMDSNDLSNFYGCWKRLFKEDKPVLRESLELFLEVFSREIETKSITQFISETDRILLRHITQEFEILEMLRENRQLLVQGGPGTGKTWLAFEQAYRLAERDKGQTVLLLSYNLALARLLAEMTARRVPKLGKSVMKSWESLARELFN